MRDFKALWRLFGFVLRRFPGGIVLTILVAAGYAAAKPTLMVFLAQCIGPALGLSSDPATSRVLDWAGIDLAGISLKQAIATAFVLGLLVTVFAAARSILVGRVTWGAVRDLRQTLCERLLAHPIAFFENRRSGELLSRINNDVEASRVAMNFLTNDALYHPFLIAGGLIYCLRLDWRMTALLAAATPLVALSLHHFGKRILKSSRKGMERLADMTDVLQQLFSGIRVVKAFGGERHEKDRFLNVNRQHYHQMNRIVVARAANSAVVDFLSYACAPLLAGGLVWLMARGWMRLAGADLVAYAAVMAGQVVASLRAFTRAWNELQYAAAGAARTYELLDEPVGLTDTPGAQPLSAVRGAVAIENVHFRYDEEPVLVDISLSAQPNQTVAIVGPSGAGKSTLLDLVPRFHDPQKGRVLVDGIDVRSLCQEDLLAHIAVVGQDTFLFNAAIEENIRYGRPQASMDEVREAARVANLAEVIDRLPEGYATVVGERGAKLSGGERQRVAIARAVLRNPKILLLDEATSDLDTDSERKVQEALDRLRRGRTTFIIAHRLSTVQGADLILVLERGRIVERGTHRELLERPGLYRRLYEQQFQD